MPRPLQTTTHRRQEQVAALAEAQSGVISRAQCLGLGMTSDAVDWMAASGRWQRLHRGIYAVHTGPVEWMGRVSAALLACGDSAVASHQTAARLDGLLDQDPPVIELLVPAGRRVVTPAGARVRRCRALGARTRPSGWPTRTKVEDTVLDLADVGDADAAISWVARACQRRLTTTARLAAALRRRQRHRWRELLAVALDDVAEGAESVLEVRYIRRVERSHGLPNARRQKPSRCNGAPARLDNAYEAYGLLVEVDGRLGHDGEGRFRDRRRDNGTTVNGWASLRFGWWDVSEQACECASDVAAVLRSRGWTGSLTSCGPRCRVA